MLAIAGFVASTHPPIDGRSRALVADLSGLVATAMTSIMKLNISNEIVALLELANSNERHPVTALLVDGYRIYPPSVPFEALGSHDNLPSFRPSVAPTVADRYFG
ncbi:hypothetical protein ACU4GI_31535 [Cupriavidus basilensis]|uniref:hypothetical protein n=1 Tax=Cupriavidus sp. SK-3 TaxID=1470558 RepID=UPI001267B5EE|nr:hypothetical protein [Cupriavidus sp. SK-3]